jgi:hypothetical protein
MRLFFPFIIGMIFFLVPRYYFLQGIDENSDLGTNG